MEYLQNGIEVSFSANGETKSDIIYIADFNNPSNNSFIVANQWTFIENSGKRPDILLFLNGLPICLFELKSPSREQTDASEAYTQIRNYMQEIPSMFIYNCICVMSDQLTSKAGTITSGEDRFMEWKTKNGNIESNSFADFTTFFEGIFQKERLLDIIKNFICFNNDELIPIRYLRAIISILQFERLLNAQSLRLPATVKSESSGILRGLENRFLWFSMLTFCSRQLIRRQSLLLQTAMIWIISFMGSSVIVKISCVRNLFRQKAANI